MARHQRAWGVLTVLMLFASNLSAGDADPKCVESQRTGHQFDQVAEEFKTIPPNSKKYWDAQFELGRALVVSVTELMEHQEVEPPAPEGVFQGPAKIAALQKQARELLERAILAVESQLEVGAAPPDNLVAGKLTLAQLANLTNEFAEAVRLLETDQASVILGIKLPVGKVRTATGIYSLAFATEVYTQLIRADIALGDLSGACRAIVECERLGAVQGEILPSASVNFGKYFKPELSRLSQSSSQQFRKSLEAFEEHLSEKLTRKTSQDFDSLAWVANVSVSLGAAVKDRVKSAAFLSIGCQGYQTLLAKRVKEPGFCTKEQEQWCKIQLARCHRQRGEFEAAVKLIAELLNELPDDIETQTEAALIYQAWGSSGSTAEFDQKCSIAMLGDRAFAKNHSPIGMWGWADLREKVAKSPNAAKYKRDLLEARYYIALYGLQTGVGQFGATQAMSLKGAYKEVLETAKRHALDPEEYDRFNVLFGRIALCMGLAVEDLPRDAVTPPPRRTDMTPDVKPETVE